MSEDKEYFQNEYGWVAGEIKGFLSKEDVTKLSDPKTMLIETLEKDYPRLLAYMEERGIRFVMLQVALDMIKEEER